MGCSSSKLPDFPSKSATSTVEALPPTSLINTSEVEGWPPGAFASADEHDFEGLLVLPIPRKLGGSDVAIYLHKDEVPTYCLRSGIMSTKLVRYDPNAAKPEVLAEIKAKSYASSDPNCLKPFDVIIRVNGSSERVRVGVNWRGEIEIEGGYAVERKSEPVGNGGETHVPPQPTDSFQVTLERIRKINEGAIKSAEARRIDEFVLMQSGRPIARIYDNDAANFKRHDGEGKACLSAPMGIHMKKGLLETDLLKALCIIFLASNRFIAARQMDTPFEFGTNGRRQLHHHGDPYYNNHDEGAAGGDWGWGGSGGDGGDGDCGGGGGGDCGGE